MSTIARWRGLKSLVADAVEHGSRAVERVQKETAARPFAILEAIPQTRGPARTARLVHDAAVGGVHAVVREISRAVSTTLDVVLDAVDERSREGESPPKL